MRVVFLNSKSIHEGNLVLVNRHHPLRQEIDPDKLVPVDEKHTAILLHSEAQTMLSRLLTLLDAKDGIVPVSGYRSLQEQETIFQDSLKENGEEFTLKYVALPNCSEHQTGLAIDLAENKADIDFIRPDFPYSGICQEFRMQAAQFGFIERYQTGKEAVTGIAWEPWHFRYIGYPHSAIMQQNQFSLEEYIEHLRDFPEHGQHLRFEDEGHAAEIFYIRAQESSVTTVSLPDELPYQLSGNNVDGWVCTLWRK